MSTKTTNYELVKPALTDSADITAMNPNWDTIDTELQAHQTALDGKAASSHNHAASAITSGTLGVARGGTGVTSNPSMLVNLASTTADTVFEASPRPGVTGTLPVANGGTGSTTAAAARTALGITPANIGAATSGHSHDAATTSAAGLMSASDKSKLDGITADADSVSISRSLTSGTKIGTITINGTATDLYCQTNTDTNTTYSAGTGISLSGTTFSNSGVRSISTGSTNGTISVNTNGTSANVAVKGLGTAAYTASTAYVAKNEDVVIQKSGAAYDTVFGQGTHNALLRVRDTAGDATNQRTIALFDSTQRPDLETAVRLYDVVDGTETIYAMYGQHNITKGTTDMTAGSSALADGAIYLVYE